MDHEGFKYWSLFLESLLDNLGVDSVSEDGSRTKCDGRFLFNVVQYANDINCFFSGSLSDRIVLAIGDRTAKYGGTLGSCIGSTSHELGSVVLLNIAERFQRSHPPVAESWENIDSLSQAVFESEERSLNRHGLELSDLASAVHTERVLFLGAIAPKPDDGIPPQSQELTPNKWVEARRINPEITVRDQMIQLLSRDEKIVLNDSLSKTIATILGCHESAVRKRGNTAWNVYKMERERLKAVIKENRRRSSHSDHEEPDSEA